MSQSVPFRDEDIGALRVGEAAPERRLRSDAALNRAKIIDAARRALADNEDTSMRAIAAKAGLGRGTVHRHFPTREGLVDAVRRQARDDADSDEEDYLRPPGELANVTTTPLSVADCSTKSRRFNSETRSSPRPNVCQAFPPPPCTSSISTGPACSVSPAPRLPRSDHRSTGRRPGDSTRGRGRHPGRL